MAIDDRTSINLLRKAALLDPDAWLRMVTLYSPLVSYWCGRKGLKGHDLEDVVQEVFAAVASGLPNYDPDRPGATFRGWLRGITQHKIQDHYRRVEEIAAGGSDARAWIENVPAPSAEIEGEPREDDVEIAALYRRALELVRSEFEERTWTAFWRAGVENQTTAEVAAALGTTPDAVRQAKSRVLRRFKRMLDPLAD